ncbi:MAG: hypothetical protein PHI20_00185, partial [Endomicrobiaceae bacterium]|nr:hypothetical protein [Endomicrobiaceae bacterium]
DVTGGGKLNVIGSKIKSGNTCIKKEGFEVIECEDTEIEGISGIVIEEGICNVLRGVKVKSRQNGILIKGESRAELEEVEIESGLLGLNIDGNNYERIEGIKIKAEEAIDVGSGELEIIDSDIEGRMTAKGIGNVGINNSSIGSVAVRGLSAVGINDSEITGNTIGISENGELLLKESRAELDQGIDITGRGKLKIVKSEILSDKTGIIKDGNENLILTDTNVISSDESISIFGNIFVNFINCKFKSYATYAIVAIGNVTVDATGLYCSGNKGLFCNDVLKFTISDFALDVFSNSLKVSNSNLIINKFKFETKFLAQNLIVDGNSKINFYNGKINIESNFHLNTVAGYPFILTTGNSETVFDNVKINNSINNTINLFSCSNKSNVLISDMHVNGFFCFMDSNEYSKVYINNSNIRSASSSFVLSGNSEVFVEKSSVSNSADFQYVSRDCANLFLSEVKTTCDSCFSLNHYSEIQTNNCVFKVKNESIVSKGFSVIVNNNSRWNNLRDSKYNIFALHKNKSDLIKNLVAVLFSQMQILVIKTRNFKCFGKIYGKFYSAGIKLYSFFMKNKNIMGIYLRRGMLNKDWIAGSSDIDFLTIINDNNDIGSEIKLLFKIHKRYKRLKNIFPLYGENIIMNKSELKFYLKYGDLRVKDIYKSSMLYGSQKIEKNEQSEYDHIKNRIDAASEILNSYILFSANYFNNKSIVNDIGFAKATIDILKNINPGNTDIDSRIGWLKQYTDVIPSDEKEILEPLIVLLEENMRLTVKNKNKIFDLVFNKINEFAKINNELIVFNTNVSIKKISKNHNVNNKYLNAVVDLIQDKFKNEILSVIIDAPGVCKVIIKGDYSANNEKHYVSDIFEIMTKLAILDNTPVLFFTQPMYQMLLFARFKNMPLEEYKLSNFSNLYKKRIFFLNNDNQYHIHGKEMLDKLLLESLADMSFQINIIDTSKDFNSIKSQLLEILFNIMELNLYFKNGIIIGDIYKKYNSFKMFDLSSGEENDLALILSVFNSSILSDEEKIIKIMAFMKNIKNDLMKEFFDERKDKIK